MSRRRRAAQPRPGAHGGLEQRLLGRLKRQRPRIGDRVIVGFSGGADSLALAAALGRVAPLTRTDVELLHIDHGLRESSGREAERAVEVARSLGLPCQVRTVDRSALQTHTGVGPEEAARRERYRLFADVLREHEGSVIALAHHQSDQAETVLLHLLRGSGIRGAAAMSEQVRLQVPWWETTDIGPHAAILVWRPLLTEAKDDVRAYAASVGIDPIQDDSNADSVYRRNSLRLEVMPELERVCPGATAALARYAHLASEVDELITSLAAAALERVREAGNCLHVQSLRRESTAVQRATIYLWLREHGLDPSFDRVEAVLGLVAHLSRRSRIEVGNGLCVRAAEGLIRVTECHDESSIAAEHGLQG